MVSYCGLLCEECDIFKATAAEDSKGKAALAQTYTSGDFIITPEELNCKGCKSDTVCEKMCLNCAIRRCASERVNDTCGDCREFPCDLIDDFVPEGTENRSRLKALHKE